MAIIFFYGSIAAVWIVFLICTLKKKITFKYIMIAIAYIGYSLLLETIFGEYIGLYHYINKSDSLFYLIVSSVFLYPEIALIYAMFLPEKVYSAIIYTTVWVLLMLIFELVSIYTRTIVLTGWKIVPWSILTYVLTFGWINVMFRYIKKRGL